MSLKSFHLFFIVVSLVLSTGFGFWATRGAGNEFYFLGVASFFASSLLLVYLVWLGKKFQQGHLALIVITIGLLPHAAEACAVCYGDPNSKLTQSANSGMMALLGVVGFVLGSFATVFSVWWRNARRLENR